MANTYHQMYIQTVFAVKYREAVIGETWKAPLLAVVGNLINETGCKTLIVALILMLCTSIFKTRRNTIMNNASEKSILKCWKNMELSMN